MSFRPYPTLRLGDAHRRRHDPHDRDGHPQPHARLVLRPWRDLGVRRVPRAGRRARARRCRPPRRRRGEGGARAGGRARPRNSTGSSPRSRRSHARFDVPISVDTWRASVLDAACTAGAVVGNDISGFGDPDYLPRRGEARRHRRRDAHPARNRACPTPNPTTAISSPTSSRSSLDRARRGRGGRARRRRRSCSTRASTSARRPRRARCCCARASALAALGYPLLLSASNKRFFGELLGLDIADRGARVAGVGRVRRDARLPHRAGARRARERARVPRRRGDPAGRRRAHR